MVDGQNDFCRPDGVTTGLGRDVGRFAAPLQRLWALSAAARTAAVLVLWVRSTHGPETDAPAWLARHARGVRPPVCRAGSRGAEPVIDAAPGDQVVVKHRYGAFTRTELEDRLGCIGRDSLLFAGFVTNVCVETSRREAVCLDFYCTLVADCCGPYSDEEHDRAIAAVRRSFGLVASSGSVIDEWGSASRPRMADT